MTMSDSRTTPDRPTIHSVSTQEQDGDYCAATLSAEFKDVEEGFEADVLTGLVNGLPQLLAFADEAAVMNRWMHLGRAFRIGDWRVTAQNELRMNGCEVVARFLRTVPLLSEHDVRARLKEGESIDLSTLLQVRCAGVTYYYADQFGPEQSVHKECLETMRILKTSPRMSDWDIALWWITPTGWLDGWSPRDIYKDDPDALYVAAEQAIADDIA
jgi:hypothetical protein